MAWCSIAIIGLAILVVSSICSSWIILAGFETGELSLVERPCCYVVEHTLLLVVLNIKIWTLKPIDHLIHLLKHQEPMEPPGDSWRVTTCSRDQCWHWCWDTVLVLHDGQDKLIWCNNHAWLTSRVAQAHLLTALLDHSIYFVVPGLDPTY